MDKKYNVIKFENKEEFAKFLSKKLRELDNLTIFNILTHQINSFDDSCKPNTEKDVRQDKMLSIMQEGLKISKYPSIFGTMKLIGSSRQPIAEEIVNSKFYPKESSACCIFAIPKYVLIGGKKVEYSSYKSASSWNMPKSLQETYLSLNGTNPGVHAKCCLLDVVKKYNELPTYYLLGCMYENAAGEIFYINPHTHLSELPTEKYDEYNQKVRKKVFDVLEKHPHDSISKIIVKSHIKDAPFYDNNWDLS